MARKTTKQTQSAPPQLSAADVATLACGSAIIATLVSMDTAGKAHAEATKSQSAGIVASIKALWLAFAGDAAGYAAACLSLFGNGEKKKELKKVGSIAADAALKDVRVDIRAVLSRARTVAANYGNADVRKAAEESGIRAGYDAAKPKAAAETKSPAPAAETKVLTDAEMLAKLVERNGMQVVVGMLESLLNAAKDPIRAAVIHEARAKLAA